MSQKTRAPARPTEPELPWCVELALQLLHNVIDKTKPTTRRGEALRRAVGQLSEHATRKLMGLHWPPGEEPPPTVRSIRSQKQA